MIRIRTYTIAQVHLNGLTPQPVGRHCHLLVGPTRWQCWTADYYNRFNCGSCRMETVGAFTYDAARWPLVVLSSNDVQLLEWSDCMKPVAADKSFIQITSSPAITDWSFCYTAHGRNCRPCRPCHAVVPRTQGVQAGTTRYIKNFCELCWGRNMHGRTNRA